MSYLPLSKVKKWIPFEEIALYCINNNYIGIINDLGPKPHIEYDLSDMVYAWNNFKNIIDGPNNIHGMHFTTSI